MPLKGLFTQSAVVLLERPVSLEAVADLLEGGADAGLKRVDGDPLGGDDPGLVRHPADAYGPRLLVPFPPKHPNGAMPSADRGVAAVDVVQVPWPDAMGDPEDPTDGQMALFAAWAGGQFGPGAFPDNLASAVDQAWHWPDAAAVVGKHRAFLRVLTTYAVGSEADDAPLPTDYSPLHELTFATFLADRMLDLPGALAYFNPTGCTVWPRELFRETVAFHQTHRVPPLPLWSNVRLMKADAFLAEAGVEEPGWSVMDTVGNGQLDLPDVELVLRPEKWDLTDADALLRNLSLELLNGWPAQTGDRVPGPAPAGATPGGGAPAEETPWRVTRCEDGVSAPPRPTVRLVAQDGTEPPAELLRVRHPLRV